MNTLSQLSLPIGSIFTMAALPADMHDWLALFGRTHVVVIHFPIALLLMAALGEMWGRICGRPAGWTTAAFICGAMGAAVSMGLGWMLVIFDGYDGSVTLTCIGIWVQRRPSVQLEPLSPIGCLPEKGPDGGQRRSSS